jgi:hypothetical protein
MTSRYTREHSIGHGNGDSALSTAEHLRDAGYATAAFVSNILLTRRVGLGQGFAVFDDDAPPPAEVDAYAADAVAMNPLQPPTEEEIECLRALGYAD